MTSKTPLEIVAILADSLRTGDNQGFIENFDEAAVFEQPFSSSPNSRLEGLAAIQQAYSKSNPLRRKIRIDKVTTDIYEGKDGDTLTVAFFITGMQMASNEPFSINSSVCIIRFQNGKIISYKDYPNSAGFMAIVSG